MKLAFEWSLNCSGQYGIQFLVKLAVSCSAKDVHFGNVQRIKENWMTAGHTLVKATLECIHVKLKNIIKYHTKLKFRRMTEVMERNIELFHIEVPLGIKLSFLRCHHGKSMLNYFCGYHKYIFTSLHTR